MISDPVYLATREYILSSRWNPYFFDGQFPGIGSPRTGLGKPWHMALAMQGLTTTDKAEMTSLLNQLVSTTADTGLMHESYNANGKGQLRGECYCNEAPVKGCEHHCQFVACYIHFNHPHGISLAIGLRGRIRCLGI